MAKDSSPDRRAVEDAARLFGGEADDTGSYVSPPPFAIRPFDWLGWTLIGIAAAAAFGLWITL